MLIGQTVSSRLGWAALLLDRHIQNKYPVYLYLSLYLCLPVYVVKFSPLLQYN